MSETLAGQIQQIVAQVRDAEQFGEARRLLGEALGLSGLASPEATARFLSDDAFAKTLIGTRNFKDWRDRMLADPLNAAFSVPVAPEHGPDGRSATSIAALARKAANAYIQWGKDGFRPVEEAVLARRRAACLACDQLQEAPDSLVYTLARKLADGDRRICAACGCLFQKKTAMPSERCPLPDVENPKKSRWGDHLGQDI